MPIQYTEMDLRNKTTSEFRTVFHSPLGVPNSQVSLYIVNELDGQFLCILNEFQIGCISRLKYVYYFTSICTSGTKPEITDLPSHMYLFLRETVYLTESAAVQG